MRLKPTIAPPRLAAHHHAAMRPTGRTLRGKKRSSPSTLRMGRHSTTASLLGALRPARNEEIEEVAKRKSKPKSPLESGRPPNEPIRHLIPLDLSNLSRYVIENTTFGSLAPSTKEYGSSKTGTSDRFLGTKIEGISCYLTENKWAAPFGSQFAQRFVENKRVVRTFHVDCQTATPVSNFHSRNTLARFQGKVLCP
jgi:hypothetical protein